VISEIEKAGSAPRQLIVGYTSFLGGVSDNWGMGWMVG
jgi:hypothetical protein